MDLQGKKINLLGDSITEGGGALDWSNCYAERLKRSGLFAAVRNYGISGTRIARQTKPSEWPAFDRHFVTRVPEMDPDADIVLLFGGTNDFGHGDAPLGTPADRTDSTFYGGLRLLFEAAVAKYPSAKIVVLTPFHRLNEDSLSGDGSKTVPGAPLRVYVEAIRDLAEEFSLPVLDLFRESGLQPNLPAIQKTYMPDGLHPNDEGHRILAEKILRFLQNL